MPTLFLSYSRSDSRAAEKAQQALESAAIGVWRDQDRIELDWQHEIAKAIAASDGVILLWSNQAAESLFVRHEWLTARALEKPIFPVLVGTCPPLPAALASLQAVDLRDVWTVVRRIHALTRF